ncbi:MAG: cupin domain-containing protein [Halieaceae bacterium]|nr:cupin domain-containing protein [Halieaceae bacterium]
MDIQKYMRAPDVGMGDVLVKASASQWIQTDPEGKAFVKVLWTSPDSGGWAVLFKWLKGYTADAHKHLGAVHGLVMSGKLKVRDQVMEAGDYVYEANGMLHEATVALEDTVHLNIADGPILFFRDGEFTHYVGWEQMYKLQHGEK